MITKCIKPVWIRDPNLPHEKMVPCGKCYNCRRKLVRTRQGQACAEQAFPHFKSHMDYHRSHFLTLTYRPEKLPMTTPRPHRMGYVMDSKGVETPFNGPFAKMRGRNNQGQYLDTKNKFGKNYQRLAKSSVTKRSGIPVWEETGDKLTTRELAYQHEKYLYERLNWSQRQIKDWLKGNYAPEATTRIKDIQMLNDRMRKEHQRNRPNEEPLRHLAASEYGEEKGRPHYHILLWGLHLDNIIQIYRQWEEYNGGMGHIFPYYVDAVMGATLMGDRAATYQAKDLVKSKDLFTGTPGTYDVETPRVFGSKAPPIGDGAYPYWFENWIAPLVKLAYKRFGNDETMVIRTILENYGVVNLPVAGKQQTFPTTKLWKQRALKDLGLEDEKILLARRATELANNEVDYAINHNVEGLGDWHEERLGELRQQVATNQGKERDRLERKWAKRNASN